MANAQPTRIASTHASRPRRRTGADPIFAAIAEMERATTKAERAEAASNEAREAYDAACRAIGLVMFRGEDVRSIKRLEALAGLADRPFRSPLSKFVGEGSALEFRLALLPARERAEYEQARAQLEIREPLFEKAKRDCRVDKREKAWNDACDAQTEAGFAVIDLEPMTRAGAVAQLGVLATILENDVTVELLSMAAAGETIRRALAVIEADAR
jgi:hypothetical protein